MMARILSIALVIFALVLALSAANQKGEQKSADASSHASANVAANNGEKLFEAHCGRCHIAPQELSPRVARTVVRHMRVRAMLSKEDEQAILNYLAPQ